MKDAGIGSAADVHFVQIKCPLLTNERIEDAERRGASVATDDTYHSMALSRGASALGVALALGEIKDAPEAAVCRDWSLYSKVASTSAGVELLRNEIVVLGNATGWAGDLLIDHDVMKDAIDADAARRVLARLGGETVAVLAKAEASPTGEIRGRRHTMLDDSDIHSTRHARALVGGVLAGVIGDTLLYVSGGAEHQGPPGGGPVAIIARI
jgi:cyanuric acid amidohydrolase